MRKKEKWLLFVMPSLVKMRLSRLVSRDNRIIYNVLSLLMPGAARRAFQIVPLQKSCRTSCAAALSVPGLFLDADGAYRAALGCGDGLRHLLRRDGAGLRHSQNPSMRNTAGHSPAHWVQPMHSSGSTNAFMQTPPLRKALPVLPQIMPMQAVYGVVQ